MGTLLQFNSCLYITSASGLANIGTSLTNKGKIYQLKNTKIT